MWRKPTDSKPSTPSSNAPVPAAPVQSAPVAPPVVASKPEPKPVAPPPAPAVQTPVPPPPVAAAPVSQPVVTRERVGASVISSGLKIRGEISGNADLVVDGELQGKISLTSAKVTVGKSGRVQADIEAGEIVIEGTTTGNLKARDSLRLGSSSRVEGSVLTPRVAIEDGARLRGKVEMVRASETRPTSVTVSKKESETLETVAPAK